MADVAALAGVSHQTVSRVLNDASLVREETRERVLEAIRQLGYRRNAAARSLATSRSGRIGMISAHLSLHGPTMISAAVHGAANRLGYDVSLAASWPSPTTTRCR
jgi:DNA-binding LacI/PurR family transcriptional regulator